MSEVADGAGECAPCGLPPPLSVDAALFLDIDGTLLEIADHPDAVCVDEALRRDVAALVERLGGAVAVISGRSIVEIDRLFAPLRLPVAGEHGSRRRDGAGGLHEQALHAPPASARETLARFAREHPGVMLEAKERSLALHFRGAPQAEAEARAVLAAVVAKLPGFEVIDGKKVLELKAAGLDKGSAIAGFRAEAPFAGRVPYFVGDDVGDERGFAVVNAAGGYSIKVGAGPSLAPWRLRDVAEVRAWLEQALR